MMIGDIVGEQHGSMLPMVGGLLFVAILVVALLADLALLQGTYRRTASSADRIAEAAAAMLDDDILRTDGTIAIDEGAATERAIAVARGEGIPQDLLAVEIAGGTVCVEVRRLHEPVAIRVITSHAIDVRVRSCAVPAVG